jgi:shikimate dehydrogenase
MAQFKLFGLIGTSLKHSFSERYFKEKFAKSSMDYCDYRNFELETIEEFPQLIKLFPELLAVNVTHPFKEQVIKYLDFVDEQAQKIGAVNVVVIKRYEKKIVLKGYNTDVYGIEVSLLHSLTDFNKKALILGTGGAAKAVQFVLKKLNINFNLVSRKQLQNVKYLYQDLSQRIIDEHKIIINTTPLGMFPKVDFAPDIPYDFISENHILFDLIYNPPLTKFLQFGKNKGATIINGQEMLIKQAEKSWEIFCSA